VNREGVESSLALLATSFNGGGVDVFQVSSSHDALSRRQVAPVAVESLGKAAARRAVSGLFGTPIRRTSTKDSTVSGVLQSL